MQHGSYSTPNPVISVTSNCGNVTDSYKTVLNNCDIANISAADDKPALLEWLSPLEPRERHQAIGIGRVAGVGDWLLLTNEFTRWNQSDGGTANPVLFCYGDPGVGKTYLSSLVIDSLCDQAGEDNMAVACVYCDFHAQKEQSATGLLGVLLKQVLSALEPIPDEVQRAFESSKGGVGGRRPLLPNILEMLTKSLSRLRRVFICIDALDEFPAKNRPELWECLQQILQKCPATRLFLTGRPHIRDEVQKYFSGTAEMLPISPKEYDIGLYLRMRLRRDSELDAMDEELEADILRIIPEAISGIFLLVSLNMDAILAEATIYQRRQALHRMTKGLGLQDAYNTTLDRIRQHGGNKSRLAMEALKWISHSERPLGSEELCHALGVELGAEDFNKRNVPSIRTVLGCTLGLVTIDNTASTVRLLHFTLQEYLASCPTLFVTPHSMMAEICLTYLNSRSIQALPPDIYMALTTTPFLEYATCFWGTHAAMGVTGPVKSLALLLLDEYENHVSAAVLWRKKLRSWNLDVQGISGLHCIAFWGIAEIAIAMLETERWQVNGRDSDGETPLMWAVKYKNNRMAKLFLEQGDIEPDMVIKDGRTVLSFAAEWGNENAVKLLLEHGNVNPDSPNNDGRTPLSFAAEWGELSVVELLLERHDINPNSSDNNGRTPLSYCASAIGERNKPYGLPDPYKGAMKLLLKRGDVNPNSPVNNGRTPLSFAAEWGELSVVELLLERHGINPNSPDNDGRTPLYYCVSAIGQWNRPNRNKFLFSLLSRRLLNSYKGVIKLLLKRGDVDPNSLDSNGRTPLSFAAERGREDLVKLLLKLGDANHDLPDNNGRAPLSYATVKEQKSVMKLLSESRTPNCEPPENPHWISTSVADENASHKVVIHPPTATESVMLHAADNPPLDAPISGSVQSGLSLEPLLLKQSPPDQSHSPPAPSISFPSLGSSSAFPSFLWTLIPFIFLFLAFMICHIYGDSLELFHAILSTWQ